MMQRCWILLLMLVGLQVELCPAAAETRVALVVGNSAYASTVPLTNPVNDARDMSAALKRAGFKVIEAVDVGKRQFDAALRTFGDELSKADVALFFYAGHGMQVGLDNYLVPVDAKLERERDLEFEAVKLGFVLRQMEIDRDGKTTIIILDACRDNPLSRNLARSMGTRSTALGRGLAPASAGLGTFIAYSTQPGNVALDGDGRNSPFTTAFVRHMAVPGRNLPATMIEVRKDVVATTGGRQVPWDHSAMTGDFLFHPGRGDPVGTPTPSSPDVNILQDRVRQLEAEAKQREVALNATQPPGVVTTPLRIERPAQAPGSPDFHTTDDVRIDGLNIGEQREPHVAACRQACLDKDGCVAFQHGRRLPVMGQCRLFGRIDARHQDPAWRSGVRVSPGTPPETALVTARATKLPASMRGLSSRTVNGFEIFDGVSVLIGEQIKMSSVDSAAGCEVVCRNTPGCTFASYNSFFRGKNVACQVYREISETIKMPTASTLVRRD